MRLFSSRILCLFLLCADNPQTWAGPPSGPPGPPNTPAVSQGKTIPLGLLLQRKVSKDDDPHLPELISAHYVCRTAAARYKICVSPKGMVDSVETLDGILGADAEITKVLKLWRFQPGPSAVCAIQPLEFEVPGNEAVCNKPHYLEQRWLAERRLSGDAPRLPATMMKNDMFRAAGRIVSYKLCVSRTGEVTSVAPFKGIPEADSSVIATMKRWRYSPLPLAACAYEFFRFDLDGSGHPALAAAPPISSSSLPLEKITGDDDPHLADAVKERNRERTLVGNYELCVATDGAIAGMSVITPVQDSDDQILSTLSGWRYKPRPTPVCFLQRFHFQIE